MSLQGAIASIPSVSQDDRDPSPSPSEFTISSISSDEHSEIIADPNVDQDYGQDDASDTADASDNASHEISDQHQTPPRSPDAHHSTRARYHGDDREWLDMTRDERLLAKSSDNEQGRNLALHLLVAHRLKSRFRAANANQSATATGNKNRWLDSTDSVSATASADRIHQWTPPDLWTVWPLEPHLVPRSGLALHVFGRRRPFHQHLPLQQELFAATLRHARSQWHSRSSPLSMPRSEQHDSLVRVSTNRDGTHDAPTPTTDDDLGGLHRNDDGDREVPAFGADDDHAYRLARPSITSLLSRLDALLLALHHNRVGQRALQRQETEVGLARSGSRSRSQSIRKFWAPRLSGEWSKEETVSSQPRGRKRTRDMTEEDNDDDNDDDNHDNDDDLNDDDHAYHNASTTRPKGRNKRIRNDTRPVAPRDWSEVLGFAAMLGWDRSALQRTVSRCTALLNETIEFRDLIEGPSHPLVPSISQPKASTRAARSRSSATPGKPHAVADATETLFSNEYVCPTPGCRMSFQNRGWRWREHMQRVHRFSAAEIKAHDERLNVGTSMSARRNPRGWVPPDSLLCPVASCDRSRSGSAFPLPRRLIDHIRRVHKYDPRRESPPPLPPPDRLEPKRRCQRSVVMSDQDEEDVRHSDVLSHCQFGPAEDDLMVGGVHNDGFLELVPARRGVRGRDRTTRSRGKAIIPHGDPEDTDGTFEQAKTEQSPEL